MKDELDDRLRINRVLVGTNASDGENVQCTTWRGAKSSFCRCALLRRCRDLIPQSKEILPWNCVLASKANDDGDVATQVHGDPAAVAPLDWSPAIWLRFVEDQCELRLRVRTHGKRKNARPKDRPNSQNSRLGEVLHRGASFESDTNSRLEQALVLTLLVSLHIALCSSVSDIQLLAYGFRVQELTEDSASVWGELDLALNGPRVAIALSESRWMLESRSQVPDLQLVRRMQARKMQRLLPRRACCVEVPFQE